MIDLYHVNLNYIRFLKIVGSKSKELLSDFWS